AQPVEGGGMNRVPAPGARGATPSIVVSYAAVGHLPRLVHRATRSAYVSVLPAHRLRRYVGGAAGVFTHTSVLQRLFLFDTASAVLGGPAAVGRVLEVGSYLGATAVVLAEALRREGHGETG